MSVELRQRPPFPPGMTSTTTPAGILVHDPSAFAVVPRDGKRKLFSLQRRPDGWWIYVAPICSEPWWGEYKTRGDALEAVRSFKRNAAMHLAANQVTTCRRSKATKSAKSTKGRK